VHVEAIADRLGEPYDRNMRIGILVFLAGCDVIFPLQDRSGLVDAQEVETVDAPPPRCLNGNDPTKQVLPAVADTILSSAVVGQNYGGLGVATISGDIGPMGSRGMFRFLIGPIDPVDVLELRLVLPSAMTSNDCGTGCGSCAGIEHAGAMHGFPSNNAWVESEVTWARASNALAWQLPGASGATDRGAEIAPAQHVVSMDTELVAAPGTFADILAWRTGDHLSFVVETTAAKQVVRTRENICDGGVSGARLEVTGC
jgi:hypothetical protein